MRDSAIAFTLSKLPEMGCFLTPETIHALTSCRSCNGRYGKVTTEIVIKSETFNLCSKCSQVVCVKCSPTNNFSKCNFVCPKNH